jgi:biotin carboxylase
MLGGSHIQVHAIEQAIAFGLRVVTCDNRPDNPGHRLAHEYHEVSTTDLGGVLALAERLGVDGVLAYASDPAALTAAYVAERLGLPGDRLEPVRRAQDKLLLREVQHKAGLPTPAFVDASDSAAVSELRRTSPSGIVLKPTDSSGSKGVTLLGHSASSEALARAVAGALEASQAGRAIAEQVWGSSTRQFGGDVLVWQGEMVAASFGDQMMSPVHESRIPIGVLCPTSAPTELVAEAEAQSRMLISALGLRQGVYNFEFRADEEGRLAVIDLGARIGGNLLGIVHHLATGLDLVGGTIRMALGEAPPAPEPQQRTLHAGHLVIHSELEGELESMRLSETLRAVTQQVVVSARPGDTIRPYRTSADRLGVLVMASEDRNLLESIYREAELHMGVRIRMSRR